MNVRRIKQNIATKVRQVAEGGKAAQRARADAKTLKVGEYHVQKLQSKK